MCACKVLACWRSTKTLRFAACEAEKETRRTVFAINNASIFIEERLIGNQLGTLNSPK